MEPTPIVWLWPGRIAIGKLTMLSGDPGLGKSLLTIDLSARVSIGAAWPDSSDMRRWAAWSCSRQKMMPPTPSAPGWTRPGPTVRVSVC